jgi:NAD dependent epimerase/dehydratase family enzyme
VALRSAMTMSPDAGGVFDTLLKLVRRGLGGTAGDGRQFVSWVHGDDFVSAIRWLIDRDDVDGVVNIAARDLCQRSTTLNRRKPGMNSPARMRAASLENAGEQASDARSS